MDEATIPYMITNPPGWILEALLAGLIGFLLWLIQHFVAVKRDANQEREQIAKVWGLALFELREAIARSISYEENSRSGNWSLGVLFFAESVSSDYFKSYTNLSVASNLHWIYAILNQIQVNLLASKESDEMSRARLGDAPIYAPAAAGFAKDHGKTLVVKFNSALSQWTEYCKKNKITFDLSIDPL